MATTARAPSGSCSPSSRPATAGALLARITAPTLVIHGADDPLVPVAAGIDTARHIPGAQLKVVPGMGHDFAPALQPAIADWIAAHIRRAPNLPQADPVAAPPRRPTN